MLLQMLNLLLAVQHLPALNAEHLTVRFLFDGVETVDERGPLGRVTLNHLFCGIIDKFIIFRNSFTTLFFYDFLFQSYVNNK